ncbi:hypothetical protein [Streptomyces sp. NPDC050704]|uniref:hypothetical protein n=1 Tax=Streptomyces sp. NPDC050704 TaxID=3157219 RepID=UPI0034141027
MTMVEPREHRGVVGRQAAYRTGSSLSVPGRSAVNAGSFINRSPPPTAPVGRGPPVSADGPEVDGRRHPAP